MRLPLLPELFKQFQKSLRDLVLFDLPIDATQIFIDLPFNGLVARLLPLLCHIKGCPDNLCLIRPTYMQGAGFPKPVKIHQQ